MKQWMRLSAGLVAGLTLWTGVAFAQGGGPGMDKSKTPDRISGQVVKIDEAQKKVTIRGSDGTTHEFEASSETLQGLKVGDQIEAKLRTK